MSAEKERMAFDAWASKETKWDLYWSENINQYMDHQTNAAWLAWQASANRQGYKLVLVDDINIVDIIWGKCSCGSSRSPIVSDREGYNLIHCFACGANKYIHEDY